MVPRPDAGSGPAFPLGTPALPPPAGAPSPSKAPFAEVALTPSESPQEEPRLGQRAQESPTPARSQ